MVDILYLTWNRREFTEASVKTLLANTEWSLVSSITFYDDASEDGADQITIQAAQRLAGVGKTRAFHCGVDAHQGSPVALMNDYLKLSPMAAPLVCKLDNDVIVPPGWLNESLAVMRANPEVDILGIEPGVGPNPLFTRASKIPFLDEGIPRDVVTCDFIGGIGLWKRSIFSGREIPNASGRFGWGPWQEKQTDLVKAWIAPGLPLFLLNRLPVEPWAGLSARYVQEGWQRPWPEPYPMSDSYIWEWWKP